MTADDRKAATPPSAGIVRQRQIFATLASKNRPAKITPVYRPLLAPDETRRTR